MPIKGFKRQHDYQDDGGAPIVYPAYCMCCWDSGLVRIPPELYSFFIEGEQERPFICSRPTCIQGKRYHEAYATSDEQRRALGCMSKDEYTLQFDIRFTSDMCESLHQYQREQWRKTVVNARLRQRQINEKIQALVQSMSIPSEQTAPATTERHLLSIQPDDTSSIDETF